MLYRIVILCRYIDSLYGASSRIATNAIGEEATKMSNGMNNIARADRRRPKFRAFVELDQFFRVSSCCW